MKECLPLITILTPVYNGEEYLSECIESVLKQTYENWEYIIVNNCSTDSTLQIAGRYASADSRIRVVSNSAFVDVIENHNIAFSHVSENSKYCKVVSADDWIYPECVARMAALAEEHPSVGLVGCYVVNSTGVKHSGLPPGKSVFEGSEICRLHLLGGPQVMGAPTACLYRSDLVRSDVSFFPGNARSADLAACFKLMEHHDFGFVHQVLAYERIHQKALSVEQASLRAFSLDRVLFLAEFGQIYLSHEEYGRRFSEVLDEYYSDVLASAFVKRYAKPFWDYHRTRLEKMGIGIDRRRLLRAVAGKMVDLLLNPKQTIEKMRKRESEPGRTNG